MTKLFKISALLLIIAMLLSCFVACSDTSGEDGSAAPSDSETERETVEVPSFEETGLLALFANGEYTLKVIRSEYADSTDTDAYAALRDALKRKTKANPAMATDFVAASEEKYDGPAILVGDTNYAESEELNAKLKNNEYAAKLVGNKYVIAYKCPEGFDAILRKIRAKLNSADVSLITIDESWNFEGTLEDISYVPDIAGGWDESFDGGQSSTYCIKEESNLEEYEAYLGVLAENGFVHHSGSRIADCAFDLLYTDKTIAYLMYFSDTKLLKLSMDSRKVFSLPTLEKDNVYEKVNDATITQVGLGDSINNGMLYISKMSDGSFIIIDGGVSSGYIYDSLVKLAGREDDIRVAAWLITHHHQDHAEGFKKTSEKYADKLIVEKIIHCQPRATQLKPGEGSDYEQVKNRIVDGIRNFQATNPDLEQIKAHPGMEIYIRDAKITVIATIDTVEPKIISNVNNASMVFRMEVGEKSMIFLGDSEQMQTKPMYKAFGEEYFRCDALQLAHHGYGNTNTGNDSHVINVASKATVVFCPVSTYHLTADGANVLGMPQNFVFFRNPDVTVHFGGEDNVTLDLYTLEQIGERWEPKD